MTTSTTSWYQKYVPKIYMLTSSEYPKFEHPRGSGVMHEYPHYMVAGKKVPTGHLAFACLLGIYATVKVAGMAFGGSKSSDAHAHSAAGGSLFPAPKRDFSAEKQEFVDKFVAAELAKQKH